MHVCSISVTCVRVCGCVGVHVAVKVGVSGCLVTKGPVVVKKAERLMRICMYVCVCQDTEGKVPSCFQLSVNLTR